MPWIEADRTRLEFGGEFGNGVWAGTSVTETLQVRNVGQQPLVVSQPSLSGPQASNFQIELLPAVDGGTRQLQSLERAFVAVHFQAAGAGVYSATLTVNSTAANQSMLAVPLQATVVTP